MWQAVAGHIEKVKRGFTKYIYSKVDGFTDTLNLNLNICIAYRESY